MYSSWFLCVWLVVWFVILDFMDVFALLCWMMYNKMGNKHCDLLVIIPFYNTAHTAACRQGETFYSATCKSYIWRSTQYTDSETGFNTCRGLYTGHSLLQVKASKAAGQRKGHFYTVNIGTLIQWDPKIGALVHSGRGDKDTQEQHIRPGSGSHTGGETWQVFQGGEGPVSEFHFIFVAPCLVAAVPWQIHERVRASLEPQHLSLFVCLFPKLCGGMYSVRPMNFSCTWHQEEEGHHNGSL